MIKTTQPALHADQHLPDGSDPIPGLPTAVSGPGLEDIILAHSPAGLWKLDELTGSTAADSTGNGNDMTVPGGGYLAPTWGQTAGPPGTTAALWTPEPAVSDAGTRLNVALPAALTDNFSAGVWFYLPSLSSISCELVGQGLFANTNSWALWFFPGSPDKLLAGQMGATSIYGNNSLSATTWYLGGLTRQAGITTLYVNGLAQAATTSTGPGSSSAATWLGNCGASTSLTHGSTAIMSWAFITDTPLTGADWLEIYETGTTGGSLPAGQVWTSDGAGGAAWGYPTIEVEF